MSFDIFLQRFAGGNSAEVNRESVLAVLRTTRFSGPDAFGAYIIEFPNGQNVEFSAKGLEGAGNFTGCVFHIRVVSAHLMKFMLDVAKAGDMVLLPAMKPFVPILSLPGQFKDLPVKLAKDNSEPVVCNSPEELELLLSGGYAAWLKYRDQILRRWEGQRAQSP